MAEGDDAKYQQADDAKLHEKYARRDQQIDTQYLKDKQLDPEHADANRHRAKTQEQIDKNKDIASRQQRIDKAKNDHSVHHYQHEAKQINDMKVEPRQLGIGAYRMEQIADFYKNAENAMRNSRLDENALGIIGHLDGRNIPHDFNVVTDTLGGFFQGFTAKLSKIADDLNNAAKHYEQQEEDHKSRFEKLDGEDQKLTSSGKGYQL